MSASPYVRAVGRRPITRELQAVGPDGQGAKRQQVHPVRASVPPRLSATWGVATNCVIVTSREGLLVIRFYRCISSTEGARCSNKSHAHHWFGVPYSGIRMFIRASDAD